MGEVINLSENTDSQVGWLVALKISEIYHFQLVMEVAGQTLQRKKTWLLNKRYMWWKHISPCVGKPMRDSMLLPWCATKSPISTRPMQKEKESRSFQSYTRWIKRRDAKDQNMNGTGDEINELYRFFGDILLDQKDSEASKNLSCREKEKNEHFCWGFLSLASPGDWKLRTYC